MSKPDLKVYKVEVKGNLGSTRTKWIRVEAADTDDAFEQVRLAGYRLTGRFCYILTGWSCYTGLIVR